MISEDQIQLVKQWVDTNLPDKYLIRASLGLVAFVIIIPGVFQLGPPKWLGDADYKPAIIVNDETLSDESSISTKKQPSLDHSTQRATISPDSAAEQTVASTTSASKGDGLNGAAPFPVGQTALLAEPSKDEQPAVRAKDMQTASPQKTKPKDKNIIKSDSAPQRYEGTPPAVARVFVKTIPAGHHELVGTSQKDQFIGTVLPLILASNEEILQRRMAILRAIETSDLESLQRWARLYRLSSDGVSIEDISASLLQRADDIPVPIALAQAVVESGWGTSRFARQGNALFGQWAWDKSAGIRPLEASNSRAVVRSFPNLFGSVRAYMHNLNTHSRYQPFRQQRQKMPDSSNAEKALQLVEYLDGYAETGYDYVTKLRSIMRTNRFAKYADAYLQ